MNVKHLYGGSLIIKKAIFKIKIFIIILDKLSEAKIINQKI